MKLYKRRKIKQSSGLRTAVFGVHRQNATPRLIILDLKSIIFYNQEFKLYKLQK